jgi:glycosyltransferase involved in cell wall biosynthesis
MSPDAFRVTYNGIQFDLLKPRRDAAEIRNELHLDSESFVFGTAANLKPWKRIDRLLTAVENISARHVRVLIVGDGVDRSRLEAIVKERRLASRVVFAGAQSHVADYLQVMDAFCLPSTGLESFGNAVVEAMALALPVIIFADGGGMVEHIDDGRTGFIVAGQEGLEDRLCTLLDDPTLRSRIGTAASTSVRARYTPERAIRAYRDLYAAALG